MKKIYFLLVCILMVQLITAQNLASKIPANANAVATINMGKFTELMPAEEWDKTALGKKLKEMRAKDSSSEYNSIKDFGIDLKGTIYYFHTEDDSMHYNTVLVPLADASKLDKLLGKKELLRLADNVRKVTEDDSTGFFTWNNQQLVYVNAIIKDAYFRNTEVAARHGLSYKNYYDVVSPAIAVDTVAVEMEEETVIVDTTVIAIAPPATIIDEEVETDSTAEAMEYDANENDFDYYNDLKIKKRITAACAAFTANEIFYKTPASNILSNGSFTASGNANAAASIWIDKPMDLYYNMIPTYYFAKPTLWPVGSATDRFGYKSFSSHLTMNEKQMNFHSEIEMSAEMASMQEKIMDRKINKRFYKYINTDSMLGYMAWAMDTKTYLQQFPALMEKTYGSMGLGIGADEYSLAAEFFSFLIDEEAVASMFKGDAMVLFDGVFQQETTYTDYTYNDNFEESEVIKTKKETLPSFLMMMSSEENNLAKKLVSYGIKNSLVKEVNGFYEMEIPKSPMRFYFMYKDDVFFLTNSQQNIQDISTGSFKANISKEEKKFIGNHNFSMYINPKNIGSKIAATDLGATESLSEMINIFNKMGTVRMKLNPLKNNISSTDMWMDVPAGNSNALVLFLSFFEGLVK